MSDSSSIRSSRMSTILSRPQVPLGPRTRQASLRASSVLDSGISSSHHSADIQELAARSNTSSPRPPSPSSSLASSARKSLPSLSEEPNSSDMVPAYIQTTEYSSPSTSQITRHEQSSTTTLVPATISTVSTAPPTKVVPAMAPPSRLVPPPPIKFDITPVPWKGLPLEAALWTINSNELQNIVSRAIRSSVDGSFIRLLTLENIDTVLPAELERLDHLRAMTQSKYRFLAQRRTMLFHALNSTSLGQQKEGDGVSVVSQLASQLAETITECDKNLEEVLNITDQIAQINKLLDSHVGSALAIALRKLNGSFARKVADLSAAKDHISQLEAEVAEAWKEAEKLARELNDYEAAITSDDVDAIIETAEVVSVPKTNSHSPKISVPMTPTLVAFTPRFSSSPETPSSPVASGLHNFVFPPPALPKQEIEARDIADTMSVKSTRSARSGTTPDRTSFVQAAKRKSTRLSQSSLRLSVSHVKKPSNSHIKTAPDAQPPVPDLPTEFSSLSPLPKSFFSHNNSTASTPLRRQLSLDSVRTGVGHLPQTLLPQHAADDLCLTSPIHERNLSNGISAPRSWPKDPSKSIPSMWMNVDAVKTQYSRATESSTAQDTKDAENNMPLNCQASTLSTSTRSSTYSKLKGLTKRYSVSLPFSNNKSNSRPTSRRSG